MNRRLLGDECSPIEQHKVYNLAKLPTEPADPFQHVRLPEVIEEYLDHGKAKCVAFNRRGTLLAGKLASKAAWMRADAAETCCEQVLATCLF
jgi:hypothetical protein